MSYLFDKSADEPVKKKASKRRREQPAAKPEPEIVIDTSTLHPIGRYDGVVECLDTGCLGQTHDILDESHGEWLLECCWCGTKQRIKAVEGHVQHDETEDFVLKGGRFDGLSLGQIAKQRCGAEYIAWAAGEHPREAVRKACQAWVDARKATR